MVTKAARHRHASLSKLWIVDDVSLLNGNGDTMDKSFVTTFTVDTRTAEAIDSLKEAFGVKTTAAVLRKAIALARIVARNADEDGIVSIEGPTRKEQVTLVA
jgi:hypothetical protein